MRKTLALFTALTMLMLNAGCKKEQQPEPGPPAGSVADYKNHLIQEHDGYFELQSFKSLASQENGMSSSTFLGYYKRNGNEFCIGYDVFGVQNSHSLKLVQGNCAGNINEGAYLDGLRGRNITLYAEKGVFEGTFTHSIYIPTKIIVSSPKFENDAIIMADSSISWNVDKDNPKGDMLFINYDPTEFGNEDFATAFPARIEKGISLNSRAGSYTFIDEDFKDFPDGAYINISVQRYNYEMIEITGTGEKLSARVGSMVDCPFRLRK